MIFSQNCIQTLLHVDRNSESGLQRRTEPSEQTVLRQRTEEEKLVNRRKLRRTPRGNTRQVLIEEASSKCSIASHVQQTQHILRFPGSLGVYTNNKTTRQKVLFTLYETTGFGKRGKQTSRGKRPFFRSIRAGCASSNRELVPQVVSK